MKNKKITGTLMISSSKDFATGKTTWANARGEKITAIKGKSLAKTMKKSIFQHPGYINTVYFKTVVVKTQKAAASILKSCLRLRSAGKSNFPKEPMWQKSDLAGSVTS